MTNKDRCNYSHDPGQNKHRRGHGSFWMQDPKLVFGRLKLKDGDCFLDLGCGPGDYSIVASEIVGDSGLVYALDRQRDAIDNLVEKANVRGLENIKAMVSDITEPLPLEDNCVDVCFIATVLHSLNFVDVEKTLFNQVRRVLKPGGHLAIIECKKEDQPFGPPMYMRLSPEDLEDSINKYGFEKISLVDLGYNYMIQFIKNY